MILLYLWLVWIKRIMRQGESKIPHINGGKIPRRPSSSCKTLLDWVALGIVHIAWRVWYKNMACNATFFGVGRRNIFFLCICTRNCIIITIVIINIIVYIVVVVVCQNRQVIATCLGCCWYSGGAPRVPATSAEKWVRGMEGDSGIAIEDICEDGMWNLGGGLLQMSMRAGILFGVAAVVAVAMVGVMSFFEKSSVLVTEVEVECLGVSFGLMEGDNLYLG